MGQKAKVKLAQGKRVKTMAEAKEKAANRAKYLAESTVKESKLKTEEKDKRKHYQNLFRMGCDSSTCSQRWKRLPTRNTRQSSRLSC